MRNYKFMYPLVERPVRERARRLDVVGAWVFVGFWFFSIKPVTQPFS